MRERDQLRIENERLKAELKGARKSMRAELMSAAATEASRWRAPRACGGNGMLSSGEDARAVLQRMRERRAGLALSATA